MGIYLYLLLTIAIESAALGLLMRRWDSHTQIVLLLANAFTWSQLQWLWRYQDVNIWALEIVVSLAEGFILHLIAAISLRKALLWGVLINAASLGIGILLHGLPQ